MDAFQVTWSTAVATQPRTNEFAWHSLLRQFTVAHDLGIGVVGLQGDEQRVEGQLLGWCPGVSGSAFLVEATFIADADGVGVVVAGVGADHLFGTAEVQLAVAGDVVVVAAALPAAGLVHLVELLHRDVLVGAARRAVNNNQVYSSHFKTD